VPHMDLKQEEESDVQTNETKVGITTLDSIGFYFAVRR